MNHQKVQVVAAIIIRRGRVLAVKRGEEFMKGRIDIPAGKIEKSENHEAALKREVKEETGYEIEVEKFLGSGEVTLDQTIFSNHFYQARIVGGQADPQSEEVDEVLWATPKQILNSALKHGIPEEKIIRLVEKIKELIKQSSKNHSTASTTPLSSLPHSPELDEGKLLQNDQPSSGKTERKK